MFAFSLSLSLSLSSFSSYRELHTALFPDAVRAATTEQWQKASRNVRNPGEFYGPHNAPDAPYAEDEKGRPYLYF